MADPEVLAEREQTENQPAEEELSETENLVDSEVDVASGGGPQDSTAGSNSNFGEAMTLLKMSLTDITLCRKSFDLLLASLGNDREAVGDAIYGTKVSALVAIKDSFKTPRAVMSLRFFNCFRLLLEKAEDHEELKMYVETLAFKHLGLEITETRVDRVIDAFLELLTQNVPALPPGSTAAWRTILSYCGSCYRFVGDSYGERLRVIKEDWASVQRSAKEKEEAQSKQSKEDLEAGEAEEDIGSPKGGEKIEGGAETFSFGRMCAFSNEVMGQKTEGWMEELLKVFHVLVDMISSPIHLQEECDLLAINLITRSTNIDFEKFKPVMLAALRSLLPKQWSTLHENAWEWLWRTVARNLNESTTKVRAFKPYNVKLFSTLEESQLDRFRKDVYTDFFSRAPASQDLFKQSQTRLRYIADRVLQASSDMFQKNKDETLDDLSALGLRHVGYGIPIELFGPFVESCVAIMRILISEFTNDNEKDVREHMMVEGFRWSIGLTARVLVRTIMDGSTAVMQAIHLDDPKRLRRALLDAPRIERFVWQLAVMVGSQSISPLFWALRSGAHATAKTMIEDILTIRADRDHYYFGVDELFQFQPNIADNILREAPFLADTLLDGLIWRSHKSKDNLRPVIYYLKHLLQDMDETQMLSRALISYVRFNHPQTIMHPILTFSLDLLWDRLAKRFFVMDRILGVVNCIIFIVAECWLVQAGDVPEPTSTILAVGRILVYTLGFCRLLYWHISQTFLAYRHKVLTQINKHIWIPYYLTRGSSLISFMLMMNLLAMMMVEPLFICLAKDEDRLVQFECENYTDIMCLLYEIFVITGVFLYVALIVELGSVSIKLSEYRVLCLRAIEQVLLCLGVVFLVIFSFAFAISGMTREVENVSTLEWSNVGATLSSLIRLAFGAMDLGAVQSVSSESPLLIVVIVLFMMMVYSFFFNLLVSQFCGVYTALAADIKGHARLARGEIIIETFKAVKLSRWQKFMGSLNLEERVDFEEGDIGLAGGIKNFEPALAHPVAKDQIVRFGGLTDPQLPWPEKFHAEADNIEKTVQRTIQKSLQRFLGGNKKGMSDMDGQSSSHHSSSSGKNDL